ncbi:MAG: trypsin-like peptidase domain-containing protein [Moraxellaceae bacterium]|nr:trypsin-like peptidase domain-containing protein [Moraxellaceae bacterium]
MRFKTLFPWILLTAVLLWAWHERSDRAAPTPAAPTLANERSAAIAPAVTGPASYASAVQLAAPAVVNIYTSQKRRQQMHPLLQDPFFRRFFGDGVPEERMQSSLGSGVIVSAEGYVLTNNHVVAAADEIRVALRDGRETTATVVGTDPGTDLAVLRIALKDLPVLPFRETPMQVGDVVLAIGNPFGVGQTVTQGIVSALGRQGLGINTFEDFIQTDAAINPGNSGGALVDVAGNLVGVNSAIYSRSGGSMGIGFAIPAALAKDVMNALVKDGKVVRGWLGIEVRTLDEEMAAYIGSKVTKGVAVAGVVRGGPAHKGGMAAGDIIVQINGDAISDSAEAIKRIAALKPDTELKMVVVRDNREIELRLRTGERPAQANAPE